MSDDEGFYTKKTIVAVVGISLTQIDRLEGAEPPKFPQRVQLSGTAPNSKVGWYKKEIHAWCLARAAARSSK
jgi:predicted DNA-binding transcriptional regulator AlpA